MTVFSIRRLDKRVSAAAFDCRQPALNEYICRYASQDVKRNVSRVFIATPEHDVSRLAGFYTLSAGSISCSDLPAPLSKSLPKYPVPIALIGRLAVDVHFQGKGLGSILLADACKKIANASASLAMAGIVVQAKDEAATGFYRHFGFKPLPGQPDRLLLPATAYCS